VHRSSLETSTALSGYSVKNFIEPLELVGILNEVGIKFMLLGALGLGG
jgi:hypothetical protein